MIIWIMNIRKDAYVFYLYCTKGLYTQEKIIWQLFWRYGDVKEGKNSWKHKSWKWFLTGKSFYKVVINTNSCNL